MLSSFRSLTSKYISNDADINELRRKNIEQLLVRYPGKVPVRLHKHSSNLPLMDVDFKSKLLVASDMYFSDFVKTLYTSTNINHGDTICFFINNNIIPSYQKTMGELYKKYRSADYILHIVYAKENVFG
jgi:hypothetical protein